MHREKFRESSTVLFASWFDDSTGFEVSCLVPGKVAVISARHETQLARDALTPARLCRRQHGNGADTWVAISRLSLEICRLLLFPGCTDF